MTGLLIKLFIKNGEDIKSQSVRVAYGNLGSAVGIVCNLLLFAVKLTAGILAGRYIMTMILTGAVYCSTIVFPAVVSLFAMA